MTKDEIISKANQILEETKNNTEKHENERKIIYNLIENLNDDNIEILENVVKLYEKIDNLEKENNKYAEVKSVLEQLKMQQTRKSDDNSRMHVFLLTDKNNETYTFFTRENAKKYLKENEEIFEEDTEIKVSPNKEIDLEKLINITN